MPDFNNDGYAWSISVKVLKRLIQEALDGDMNALHFKVISPDSNKPINTRRFKLFVNNGGRHPGSNGDEHPGGEKHRVGKTEVVWMDDFPPIPPGP